MAKTFVQRVVNFLKSDDAESIAKGIQKKGNAVLKAQIAAKEAHTLNLEEALDSANESKEAAVINYGKSITYNDSYVEGILRTAQAVELAQENLTDHLESIETLKAALKEVNG